MLLLADNNECRTKDFRHQRRRHRRAQRRYYRRTGYWRKDCGSLLKTPLSFVHSMGRRMLEWLELRQERFLHTRTSPEDMDRALYEFSKVSAERCFYLPPSTPPQVRAPHHLRRPPFKIYVPRRRLPGPSTSSSSPRRAASFRKAHYQSIRGRPVPVPLDVIKFLTQRGVVSMSSLPKVLQENLREISKIPEYLTFSSYVNTSLLKRDDMEADASKAAPSNDSSKYFATFVPACSEESYTLNVADITADNSCFTDGADVDKKSAFSVASSNVSPKLLEVVASLRAKSVPPQPMRDWTKPNNLDRPSVKSNCQGNTTCSDTRRSLRCQQTQSSEGDLSSYSSRKDHVRRSCHNLIERPQCSKLSIFNESVSPTYNYCLPANVTDFRFDDQDNFWRNDSKRYSKSVVALTDSVSSYDENAYDAIDPIYDAISDSGYSSIALSSQESVDGQTVNKTHQPLHSEPSPMIINASDDAFDSTDFRRRANNTQSKCALARLSQSFGRFSISNKNRKRSKSFEIYVDLFGASEEEKRVEHQRDDSKWRTKSAEELSLYSSVDVTNAMATASRAQFANIMDADTKFVSPSDASQVKSADTGKMMVTPKPQRSFLHSPASLHAVKFNQQLCVKRELPPIPVTAQNTTVSESGNTSVQVGTLPGIITNTTAQVSIAPSVSVDTDATKGNPLEKPRQLSGASDGRPNLGGNGRSPSNQVPKRTFPTGSPFGSTVASSPAPLAGQFRPQLTPARAPTAAMFGVGGVGIPSKRFPLPHLNSPTQSSDTKSNANPQAFRLQLNAQLAGKPSPINSPPTVSPSAMKAIFPPAWQSPLKFPSDGGVLAGSDVTPAPLQHVARGGPGLQKGLPAISPTSDGTGHPTRPNPAPPGRISGARRTGLENLGVLPSPMAAAPPPPRPHKNLGAAAEDAAVDGDSEFQNQESVRLSTDGQRIVLTPLYKSLIQQDFFHLVTRESAEVLLKGCGEGSFLVRPSTRGHPLTLMLIYQGSSCNIGIRHRPDGLFALGAEKDNEKTFKSVEELIEFYGKNLLKLNTGGQVLLLNSPAHDATHIYVRVPIKNGFPGARGRDGP